MPSEPRDDGQPFSPIVQACRDRRLRMYLFDANCLVRLIGGKSSLIEGQLPQDAVIYQVGYDLFRDSVFLTIASTEFDPVPKGELIPRGDFGLVFREIPTSVPEGMLTLDQVRERVAAVEAAKGDCEAAHSYEDELHQQVLWEIAKGHPDAAKLADEALKTLDIRFGRYCA